MIAPIDDRIRTFHKGLFTSEVFGYEDPTYLGFSLHFDFDPVFRDMETGQTQDSLFAEPGLGLSSAQEYLTNIGFPQRARMIKEFKEMIRYMNKNAPYFFQEISGVAELWKVEKKGFDFEPHRGFDKKLKFKCLESIDLRMTALADLYRKATFDYKHMRELLPENLRWFTLKLRIAEIRKFHTVKEVLTNSANEQQIDQFPNEDILKIVDNYISVVEFELGHCEFNFEESFADEFNVKGETEMAMQQFTIEVGHIEEKAYYKLLDIAISDHYAAGANGIVEHSWVGEGGKFGGNRQDASSNRPVMDEVPLNSRIPGYDNAINPNNLFNGAVSALQGQAQSLSSQLGGVGGQLINGAVNRLQSRITGIALGNVYGLRNRTLLETINGFISGGESVTLPEPTDVYPTVPGKDSTTVTATDLGNAHTNGNRPTGGAQAEANRRGLGNANDVYPGVPGKDNTTKTADNLGNAHE